MVSSYVTSESSKDTECTNHHIHTYTALSMVPCCRHYSLRRVAEDR